MVETNMADEVKPETPTPVAPPTVAVPAGELEAMKADIAALKAQVADIVALKGRLDSVEGAADQSLKATAARVDMLFQHVMPGFKG
jgi:hypothetical protein